MNLFRRQTLHGRPLRVFQDDRELDDFDMLTPEVNSALDSSRCLVALYSENLPASAYCRFEIRHALSAAHHLDGTPERVMALPRNLDYESIRPGRLGALRLTSPETASNDALVASVLAKITLIDERTFGEAPAPPPPKWYPAPLLGTGRFVGRHLELWEVYDALHNHQDPGVGGAPVARIVGTGGIGKSMLAEQYAREFASDYPEGVFVLRGFGSHLADHGDRHYVREHRAEQVRDLVRRSGIDTTDMDADAIERALKERLTGQRYLWIVDDLPARLDQETFASLVAPTPEGHTVVTTRYVSENPPYPWGGQVRLGELDDRSAMDLLTRDRAPKGYEEERSARELALALGRYPLALAVASGLVLYPATGGYTGLLTSLRSSGPDVLELGRQLWGDLPEGHGSSIAATLLRSMDHLGPHGVRALRTMSLVAPAPVPQAIVERALAHPGEGGGTDPAAAVVGLGEAAGLSLVQELPGAHGSLWSAHSMVTRTVRFTDTDHDGRERVRRALVAELTALMEGSTNAATHRTITDFLPHVHEVVRGFEGEAERHLLDRTGRVHIELGEFRRGLDTYESLHRGLRALPEQPTETALRVEAGLGLARGLLGDHQRALEHKSHVHRGLLALYGPNDPGVIMAENNLGVTYNDLGDHQRAGETFARVYRARRRLLQIRHPDTLQALANYSIAVAATGDHRLALRLKKAVLTHSRSAFGEEHILTLDARNSVAASMYALGQRKEAHRELRDLHKDLARLLGPHHLDTLVVRESMAVIGPSRTEGYDHLEAVYLLLRNSLAPDHSITRRVLRRFLEFSHQEEDVQRIRTASGADAQVRSPKADPRDTTEHIVMLADQLQEDRTRAHGPDAPLSMVATCLLAHSLALQGSGMGAFELIEDSLTGMRREWGSASSWSRAASWLAEWIEDMEAKVINDR